jgi:predicted aspartyl protease
MPCLSINYVLQVGPLLQISIEEPNFQAATTSHSNPANLKTYMALIDTGASCTAVSPKVISDLKLAPVSKQQISGVHGTHPTNLYQFQVILLIPQTQLPTGIVHANIFPFPVIGSEFMAPGAFDVLLGRDVLCRGVFNMSFDGHASFSF